MIQKVGDIKMSKLYLKRAKLFAFLLCFQIINLTAVDLYLEDSIASDLDGIEVPIKISNVSGMNIISIDLEITFDQEIIQIQNISNESCISSNWEDPLLKVVGNSAQILLFGTQPLEGSGDLLTLRFEIVGQPGDVANINFEKILLNEGDPEANGSGCNITINKAPLPFDLYSPEVGSSVSSLPIILDWQVAEDTPDDLVSYNVLLSDKLANLGSDTLASTLDSHFNLTRVSAGVTYYWKVVAEDKHGVKTVSNNILTFNSLVSSNIAKTINQRELLSSYPNPFLNRTTIRYEVSNERNVLLCIYNMKGQIVRHLVDGGHIPGIYTIDWDGKDDSGNDVAKGIYIYQMRSEDLFAGKKLMLQ